MSCSFLFFFPGCAALATLLSDGPFFCLLLPNLLVSLSPRIIASGVTKGTGHLPCLPVIAFLGLDWEYREVNFVSKAIAAAAAASFFLSAMFESLGCF